MGITVHFLILIVSFGVLIKGADFLVNGSTGFARMLKVSGLIIGLTIVSFGTSAPELFVNIMAALKGNSDLAIANVLGSNICNILLVLGLATIFAPLVIQRKTVMFEIPLSILAIVVLGLLANDQLVNEKLINFEVMPSYLNRADGLILLCFFIIFLAYIFSTARKEDMPDKDQNLEQTEGGQDEDTGAFSAFFMCVVGIVGLGLGGYYVVQSATEIASYLGVSDTFIGLTIVALGTSLPEVVTSVVAAYKGETGMAIGNVVGSNIFNIMWILGISAVIKPLSYTETNNFHIVFLFIISFILMAAIYLGKKHQLGRVHGIFFVILYLAYITFLVLNSSNHWIVV